MKDIGEKFKEAREQIGISIIEASNDMGITEAQLENLEDGNANAFKDVYFLKELIKKYAKYLNLDGDELLDEYADFMFNFTSKISVSEIEKRVEEIIKSEEKEKKISSPYTKNTKIKTKKNSKTLVTVILVSVVLALIMTIILIINSRRDDNDFIGLNLMEVVKYEFTK